MKPIRIASDRWNFETADGAFITPLGGNMLTDIFPALARWCGWIYP